MLWFYHFIIGYLSVSLTGKNCESLLNVAARERISFNDLHYRKGRIEGKITVSDFRRIRCCVRGTGARIHITGKHGLPFIINRYRRRIGLFSGGILFMTVLYVLSLFVWNIEVTGNHNVPKETIIAACEELGITEGTYKGKINPKVDAQRLLLCADGLAWASINIEGSVVTVNVSEIKNQQNSAEEPCNLIASADGIIHKIDLTSGNAVVAVGDAVSKGDLLVSGIIERMSGTEFVPSVGTVTAHTTRIFTVSGEFIQTKQLPTDRVRSHSVLSLFWLDIPLYTGRINGSYTAETEHKQLELFGRGLPVSITTKKCTETKPVTVEYNENELKEILKNEITKQINDAQITDYTIKHESFSSTDTGLTLEVLFSTQTIPLRL